MSERRAHLGEAGDTLIEVLFTVVIISIAFAALLGALVTSITGSTEHRALSVDDTLLKSVAESAKNQIEGNSGSPLFTSCAPSYTVNFTKPANDSQYSITGQSGNTLVLNSIKYWDGTSSFAAACSASYQIQQVSVFVSGPNGGTQELSFVVRKP